jgi:positive regulator of sigma E activity
MRSCSDGKSTDGPGCEKYTENEVLSASHAGFMMSSLVVLLIFCLITAVLAATAGLYNAGTIIVAVLSLIIASNVLNHYLKKRKSDKYMDNCMKNAPKCPF